MQTPAHLAMRIALALTAAALGLVAPRAAAQTVFGWQGTIGGTSQWASPTTWTNNAVPNAAGTIVNFIADFGGTATTVNIGAGESFTVGVINMTDSGGGNAGKFNIATNGAGATLVLDNGASKPVINYTTGGQFDNFMNVVVAGTNGFQKTGGGYVQMRYFDNTYTGTTVISAGIVRIERNLSLGNATNALELNGGALNLVAGSVNLTNRAVSVTAGTNQIQTEGTSILTISGPLSSSAGTTLRKVDTGSIVLSGTGNTLGALEFNGGSASVTGAHTNAGGFVIVKNNTAASSLTLTWSGNGSVATGSSANLLLNDGGTLVTNSTLNVTAGALTIGNGVNTGSFIVGGKGVGAANISAGTLTANTNKDVSIGSFAQFGGSGGNGNVIISGTGLFQALGAGNFYVGYGQTISGPGATNFGGTGVLNLNGGTLETGRTLSTGPNATGAVTLNGGTLKAAASNTNWIATTNNSIGASGVTIDTAGYNMGISQSLQGTGPLAKSGAGALALNAANTYAGGTTVSAGTLAINNPTGSATGSGALSVASGAILTGNGTVSGSATINGTLSPGSR